MVNASSIKETTLFWYKLIGDKPFPLSNEALVYTANFSLRDNWQMDTPTHRQATSEVEHTHVEQALHLEGAEEEEQPDIFLILLNFLGSTNEQSDHIFALSWPLTCFIVCEIIIGMEMFIYVDSCLPLLFLNGYEEHI